jgi:hypothetical protein
VKVTNKVDESNALLNEVQAAQFLCLSVRTLQSWRRTKQGPIYIQAGRAIRYRREDLEVWVMGNRKDPTASERRSA